MYHPLFNAMFIAILTWFTGEGIRTFLKTGHYIELLVTGSIWLVYAVCVALLTLDERKADKDREVFSTQYSVLKEQIQIDWGQSGFTLTVPEVTSDWSICPKVWTYTKAPGYKNLNCRTDLEPVELNGNQRKYKAVEGAYKYCVSVEVQYRRCSTLWRKNYLTNDIPISSVC